MLISPPSQRKEILRQNSPERGNTKHKNYRCTVENSRVDGGKFLRRITIGYGRTHFRERREAAGTAGMGRAPVVTAARSEPIKWIRSSLEHVTAALSISPRSLINDSLPSTNVNFARKSTGKGISWLRCFQAARWFPILCAAFRILLATCVLNSDFMVLD